MIGEMGIPHGQQDNDEMPLQGRRSVLQRDDRWKGIRGLYLVV